MQTWPGENRCPALLRVLPKVGSKTGFPSRATRFLSEARLAPYRAGRAGGGRDGSKSIDADVARRSQKTMDEAEGGVGHALAHHLTYPCLRRALVANTPDNDPTAMNH
jgi:hypothetical protein